MSVSRNRFLIISVCVVLVVLISLVRATTNAKKYRKNFEEEMAQRLDLEEKMTKMEKDRADLVYELRDLRDQLAKNKEEVRQAIEELDRIRSEKTALKSALEKTNSEPGISSAKPME